MKKSLSMLVGVALTAGTVLAQQTVNSVNAVGFVKLSVPAGKFVLASAPFNDFAASIDEIFQGQLTGSDNPGTADRVIVWNPIAGTYKYYFKLAGTGDPQLDGHMLDEDTAEIATNAYLLAGDGFWIQSRATSNQTVVLKGEVPNNGVATNAIVQGFNQIGFPFASEQVVGSNTAFYASGALGTDNPNTADRIIFWDPTTSTYKYNFLLDVGAGGMWFDEDTGDVSLQKFELGKGAWYQRRGTSTFQWQESRPYPSVSQ